jgi:hypothetical protein
VIRFVGAAWWLSTPGGAINLREVGPEMFDARYYAASDLQQMTDLRRQLVASQ